MSPLAVYRPQCIGLARSSREISQTVPIDCHSFVSRVRISGRPSIFLFAKKPQNEPKKSTLPSARRNINYTTYMCCQLWRSADTWILTNHAQNKLAVAHAKMERIICSTSHTRRDHDKKTRRGRPLLTADCAAYAKHRDLLKSNLVICLERWVYTSCVLPAMRCWCRDMNNDKRCSGKTCGRTDQNWKK